MENNPINTEGGQAGFKVKSLKIDVTPQIIATAVPANSGHCMISDAVKAAATKAKMRVTKVLTDLQTIRFTDMDNKRRYVCFTPRVGQVALLEFDQGNKPEPFSFRLTPAQIIEPQHRAQKPKPGEPGRGPSKPRVANTNKDGYRRPVKIGGAAMATSVGLRREFGLRQMGAAPKQ